MKYKIGEERLYNRNFPGRKDVVLWDVLPIKEGRKIKIKFLRNNTTYRQGIRIAVDVGAGELEINGVKNRVMELWDDTAPSAVLCVCNAKAGKISIYNVWDERGYSESQLDSSGMIVEEEETKRIYHCNDFGYKTNFDKFLFSVEIL